MVLMTSSRSPNRQSGFTLLEVVTCLLIITFAVMIAANSLTALAALSASMSVRQELYRTSENVIEGVRGGVVPLQSGTIRPAGDLGPDVGLHISTQLTVKELEPEGLYRVTVRSSTNPGRRQLVVTLATMVWRP